MKGTPSRMQATAKIVEGAISFSLRSIAARRLSAVSFTPGTSSANRSVLAVQTTTTLSSVFSCLKRLGIDRVILTRKLWLDHIRNVSADLLEVGFLRFAREGVVGAIRLVRRNKIGVVDGRPRHDRLHHGRELALQIGLEHLRTLHRGGQAEVADIPASDNERVGVNHRQDLAEGDVHVLSASIATETNGRGLRERTKVVGVLDALASTPREAPAKNIHV